MYIYDPRTKESKFAPPKNRDIQSRENTTNLSYGALPVIVATGNGKHAFATYSPQIPFAGEGSNKFVGSKSGYIRDAFPSGGVVDTQTYIREPKLRAGLNHYKVYYIVGTIGQVRKGLDDLHSFFGFLSPEVFDYDTYVRTNNLDPQTSEAGARLHCICAKAGICTKAPI
jgi:hypothetical protein